MSGKGEEDKAIMLSAIKNFFLTFIIALLIFSLVAYLAVNLVINNINGALDSKTTEAVTTAGPGRAEPVPGTDDESDGESVNILIVGCDYRGGVFADYDSKVIEERFGVVREYPVMRPVPNDLGMPAPSGVISDSGVEPLDGVKISDDRLAFRNGFYRVSYRTVETDTLMLLRFDKERGHISYTVFDPKAYVTVNGGYCRLGEVFSRYGIVALRDKIHALTGILVDRYALATMESFPKVIDAIGGVSVYVPCIMKYDDVSGNVHIDLKAGSQKLNGDKALQLLMFNSYTDGVNSRKRTTVNFVQSFISDLTSLGGRARTDEFIKAVDGMLDTDITTKDLVSNAELLFTCGGTTVEISTVTVKKTVPGDPEASVYDENATINAFSKYKKLYEKKNG